MGPKRGTPSSKAESKDEKRAQKRQKKESKKRRKDSSASSTEHVNLNESTETRSNLLSVKKLRLSASILPSGLSDVKTSIDRCIRDFLLKYSDAVDGTIMGYKNVEILADGRGRIVEELPHIHYDIRCDALVFSPVPNARLRGRVTESFHSHVSMVVFNYFNASISASRLREAGFEYDADKESWYNIESEDTIEKSSYLVFAAEKIHEAVGMISIDGSNPALEK
uniref:RPA43 OB domain-containing protein n=1 Tax=Amphora coffeiformis TaxID=265554 RepID=A0A7S3L6X0_9STRA|mmetsp:Transcript_16439/g.31232  ORF Transcript_16439/g.31232 Transcript_16439/m.31232 type:complete len:224 (+) Transcript_16439:150-821(+)|eukprot:scaffold1211_cov169-Amphora_coffeaeformis.AAC.32